MAELPTFGSRVEGVTYKYRPSAYALIRNEVGQIAVVKTPLAYFLPGGGVDPGEAPDEAIVREGREECGFILRAGVLVGRAIEICYADDEQKHFEKDSFFVTAEVIGVGVKEEADHELLWLDPAQALEALSHASHRWAVERFCDGLHC
jgi:8-oxo-dGTP diphosphatase